MDSAREATGGENAGLAAELHRRQQAMYGGGSIQPVLDVLEAEIVWHVPGRSPDLRGPPRSSSGRAILRARRALASATTRMIPGQIMSDGNAVVQLVAGRAELGGDDVEWQTVGVYRVGAAAIAEVWLVPLDLAQFDRDPAGKQTTRRIGSPTTLSWPGGAVDDLAQ